MSCVLVLIFVFAVATSGVSVADSAATQPSGWKDIDPNEFQKLAKNPDNIILDVRTPKEFHVGRIRGAVNIDVQAADFNKKVAQLDKSKTCLIYCRTGIRGGTAAKKMHEAGFKDLYNLDGGIAAWWQAGKPVE